MFSILRDLEYVHISIRPIEALLFFKYGHALLPGLPDHFSGISPLFSPQCAMVVSLSAGVNTGSSNVIELSSPPPHARWRTLRGFLF